MMVNVRRSNVLQVLGSGLPTPSPPLSARSTGTTIRRVTLALVDEGVSLVAGTHRLVITGARPRLGMESNF